MAADHGDLVPPVIDAVSPAKCFGQEQEGLGNTKDSGFQPTTLLALTRIFTLAANYVHASNS